MSTVVSKTEEVAESHAPARGLGWYGMVFFIASEAVFFANLIAAYLYLRVRDGATFNPGGHVELDKTLALVNTVILLSSSFPMHFAGRAAARGDKARLVRWLGLTFVLGATFIGIQLYEYINNGFGPSTGVVGSTFYTLTGFHGAHVTFGLLFILVNFFRASRGHFTKEKHFSVTAAEMYWHFVDAVWVVLMSLVYFL